MEAQLTAKITALVASVTRRNPDAIRPDASFDELGIDSLDRINILFELENAFNIDIPDEEARRITTIPEMIQQIQAYLERAERKGA